MKFFFLLDFNKKIGWGHLSRCSNLAMHLKNSGISSSLITFSDVLELNKKSPESKLLEIFSNNIYKLDSLSSREIALQINKIVEKNILLIDHYFLNKNIFYYVNNPKYIIQFKDDINDIDLIELENHKNKIIYFLPQSLLTLDLTNRKNIFSDIEYFPIFPPLINLKKPIEYKNSFKNILMIPGSSGSQFCNSIVDKLSDLNNFKIFTPQAYDLNNKKVFPINGANGLYDFIYFADLIISAAGNTMLESIFLKKFCLVFSSNPNQNKLISFLDKNKLIKFLPNIECLHKNDLRNIILKNSNNPNIPNDKLTRKFNCNKLVSLLLKFILDDQ